jgi:hypothetical protein
VEKEPFGQPRNDEKLVIQNTFIAGINQFALPRYNVSQCVLTNSMQQNLSSEADSCSVGHKIPRALLKCPLKQSTPRWTLASAN